MDSLVMQLKDPEEQEQRPKAVEEKKEHWSNGNQRSGN
jgi:hypothetical protein